MPAMQESPAASNTAPIETEYDAAHLRVTGRIPEGLRGTLYRNGPNPQFPEPREHWFLGDGMVHAFSFGGRGVAYRNRWVRTQRWRAERQAGQRLSQAGFGKAAQDTRGVAGEGKANTHVLAHAGRLLALEEAHLPFELRPRSLDSVGPWDANGALRGPFTAHPKTDPRSGELVFFGYAAAGPLSRTIAYGELDARGRLVHQTRFDAPYCSMVHDFAVTRSHVLFPILPLQGELERARAGGPAYAWRPELGGFVAVLARKGDGSTVRWFEAPPCYVFHVLNAWEDEAGRRLHADVMRYDRAPLFPAPDGTMAAPAAASLVRWSFDLSGRARSLEQTPLGDAAGEFPRIDERHAGLPYRHGWICGERPGEQRQAGAGIVHVDLREQRRSAFWGEPGETFSEPVFVARAPGSPEGDGWLLTLVHRPPSNTSDLLVFEATALERGPLAAVHLSHRVPAGFHGSWVGMPA